MKIRCNGPRRGKYCPDQFVRKMEAVGDSPNSSYAFRGFQLVLHITFADSFLFSAKFLAQLSAREKLERGGNPAFAEISNPWQYITSTATAKVTHFSKPSAGEGNSIRLMLVDVQFEILILRTLGRSPSRTLSLLEENVKSPGTAFRGLEG